MAEKFDVLIVGSGIAGLSAAIEATRKRKSACIVDKGSEKDSNSYYAQGGIATAIGANDSWKKHYDDTLKAGCGLCNPKTAGLITKSGPKEIKWLMDLGLEFDGNEKPELGLEGGHCENRVLHINGDGTGKEITLFLKKIAKEQGVEFAENTLLKKILADKNTFTGIETAGKEESLESKAIVLATGGYAACFEKTTNPEGTLGSGIAVAANAGCEITGMEFIQFHPTTIREKSGKNFLVTEAVRGEGGTIVNEKGGQIVNPLLTRDEVSRAIYAELAKGGKAFLDARALEEGHFEKRFPSVYAELKKTGINPEQELIPIETAAHYTIGGIKTDLRAATSIKGIYAAGECTNSGLHGANRLASNSLLEGLVMGKIAGRNAAQEKGAAKKTSGKAGKETQNEGSDTKTVFAAMKKVMWGCCGVIRDEANLKDGLAGILNLEKRIETNQNAGNIIVKDALLVSRKTFEAALARKESIGTHYRTN
ncbi:MAG: L-aspartate oxidase [archaeon]